MRPDRFFPDNTTTLRMAAIAKSIGADETVYTRNQLLKLPGQSKKEDNRVQTRISGELREHIVTAVFSEGATPMHLEALTEAAAIAAPPPRPQSTLSARRRAEALGPWSAAPPDIPDNRVMTARRWRRLHCCATPLRRSVGCPAQCGI